MKATFDVDMDAKCPTCSRKGTVNGGPCIRCAAKAVRALVRAKVDGVVSVPAGSAATAWLNAFLATSDDEARPALYRTLSVELFAAGVQFVATDGTMLFRTWVAAEGAPMPILAEDPDARVVVMDRDRFAVGFIRTMLAAAKDNERERLTMQIETAPTPADGALLGESLHAKVLTLRAFGQQLHCTLYEGEFPNWRRLEFGILPVEQVDGMKLATRIFGAVGKLRGLSAGVDCDFHGAERQIEIHGVGATAEVRGLLMPMRREKAVGAVITEGDA